MIPAALLSLAAIAAAIVLTGQQLHNSNAPQNPNAPQNLNVPQSSNAPQITPPTSTAHREPTYGAQVALPFTGLNQPGDVAVDTAGNVYVANYGNHRVLRLAAGSSFPMMLPFTGLNKPQGMAVDAAGDLFVTDPGNKRVVKLAAGSGTPVVLPFTGLN
jgi:streptogramin lyase